MIDRTLNYGRNHICNFSSDIDGADTVVDLGAGRGVDLEIIKNKLPNIKLHAVECWKPYINDC